MNIGLLFNKPRLFNPCIGIVRNASKKTGGSTQNPKNHGRPKHRGWRVQDSHYVSAGTILATQRTPRFHPGLNDTNFFICEYDADAKKVGIGKNGTLFAIEHGRVYVTCEKLEPNWDHTWVQRHYAGRENQNIYKKFFNVVLEEQHTRFKLLDEI